LRANPAAAAFEVTIPARFIVRDPNEKLTRVLAFLVLTSAVAGCSGSSDLLSRDAEWFSRPGRLFIRSISIDTPPLTPDKPITPDDLVSAEGACPGMAPPGGPADANASGDTAGAAPPGGSVALGHTECDVVRGIGAPDSVNVSGAGDTRVATVTWLRGARAGIYTFTGGRLSSVERAPDAGPAPKAGKPKGKKRAAT
jgi:hypothetical protein